MKRLSNAQKERIRADLDAGLSVRKAAEKHGVNPTTIQKLKLAHQRPLTQTSSGPAPKRAMSPPEIVNAILEEREGEIDVYLTPVELAQYYKMAQAKAIARDRMTLAASREESIGLSWEDIGILLQRVVDALWAELRCSQKADRARDMMAGIEYVNNLVNAEYPQLLEPEQVEEQVA